MAADLFGDSVDDSYNRTRSTTDDFLNEDNREEPRQTQAPTPAPAPTQQPPAQPPRSFAPEGYEAPGVVNQKRDALTRRYKALDAKLAKARNTQADSNPYSYNADDGSVQFDQMAYNDDMRQLGSIKMEIDQLSEKLRDSRDTAQSSAEVVKRYARDYFLREQERLAPNQRDTARKAYAAYFADLVRIRHFENPVNLTTDALDKTLLNIFRASVGDAVLAQQRNDRPSVKSPGTTEDDVPAATEGEDEFAGWPEESKKMFAAYQKSQAGAGLTLADKRKTQGGSR